MLSEIKLRNASAQPYGCLVWPSEVRKRLLVTGRLYLASPHTEVDLLYTVSDSYVIFIGDAKSILTDTFLCCWRLRCCSRSPPRLDSPRRQTGAGPTVTSEFLPLRLMKVRFPTTASRTWTSSVRIYTRGRPQRSYRAVYEVPRIFDLRMSYNYT